MLTTDCHTEHAHKQCNYWACSQINYPTEHAHNRVRLYSTSEHAHKQVMILLVMVSDVRQNTGVNVSCLIASDHQHTTALVKLEEKERILAHESYFLLC